MNVHAKFAAAAHVCLYSVSLGVNSIDMKNLWQGFGPVLTRGRGRPPPAGLPFFNLTSRAKIYVN